MSASAFDEKGKPISKTTAREVIFNSIAAEISRLLNLSQDNKVVIGNRPIKEQDIAVLVRRNAEAIMMQKVLADLNIPSVLYSTTNLFDSYEAMEMQRVLNAIAEPNNDRFLKTALATDILGMGGKGIAFKTR